MEKHTLEPILKNSLFFKDIKPEHLQILVGCASNVRFDPDRFIFREGDEANRFYIIREGSVAIELATPTGIVTIQTLQENEVLGWSWLFPPYRWHFDARANGPTLALALDGKCLREKCEHDPSLGYELMKRFARIVIDRLQATRLQLLDLYGTSSGGK